jgi:hypothetical protein
MASVSWDGVSRPWSFEEDGSSFTRIAIAVVLFVFVIEWLRIDHREPPIWLHYPLYVGTVYSIVGVVIYRKMYDLFGDVTKELVQLAERTADRAEIFDQNRDITGEDIEDGMNRLIDLAFSPWAIGGGVLVGGGFMLAVLSGFDLLEYYPYVGMVFLYGAVHGLYYAPLGAAVLMIDRIPRRYMIDVDFMDPDGVGGYRTIGDAIVSLVTWGIALVTIDFLVLSSASFVDRPLFDALAVVLYLGTFLTLLLIAVVGVYLFRRRLLELREEMTRKMREEFGTHEQRFWRKLRAGEDPEAEGENIQTMQMMFDQLHAMNMWPINLVALTKLAFSSGSSLLIFLSQRGIIDLPV